MRSAAEFATHWCRCILQIDSRLTHIALARLCMRVLPADAAAVTSFRHWPATKRSSYSAESRMKIGLLLAISLLCTSSAVAEEESPHAVLARHNAVDIVFVLVPVGSDCPSACVCARTQGVLTSGTPNHCPCQRLTYCSPPPTGNATVPFACCQEPESKCVILGFSLVPPDEGSYEPDGCCDIEDEEYSCDEVYCTWKIKVTALPTVCCEADSCSGGLGLKQAYPHGEFGNDARYGSPPISTGSCRAVSGSAMRFKG